MRKSGRDEENLRKNLGRQSKIKKLNFKKTRKMPIKKSMYFLENIKTC